MERLKASEISKMIGGTIIRGDTENYVEEVVIDSREAKEKSLFVALKGEQTDGHRFIESAYDNGARTFIISDEEIAYDFGRDVFGAEDATIILVEDTLRALQDLSEEYLHKRNIRSIAVTGSVGKTTTRDMLYAAMSTKYKTGTNKKNYNSETGLPLTLLSFTNDMEMGVLEMGMDDMGQIARLVEIVEPEAAIITNIGISHIEKLLTRENILKAKMEITNEFDSGNTLVVNADDSMLDEVSSVPQSYNVIRVGSLNNSKEVDEKRSLDYIVSNVSDKGIDGIEFCLKKNEGVLGQPEEIIKVKLSVPGGHNAINCALAIAGAGVMGVPMKDAVKGIKNMKMTGSRLRILDLPETETHPAIKIIDDAYNAAPASVKSAMATLMNTVANRRVAVLGGINELGELSEQEHRDVGKYVGACKPDLLITIGEMGSWIGEEAKRVSQEMQYMHFDTKEGVYPLIWEIFKPGDVVLLKASRTYELEKLADEIAK